METASRRAVARIVRRLVVVGAVAAALLAPSWAVAEPAMADLASAKDSATAALADATASLAEVDTHIGQDREELAGVESRLPSNGEEQMRAAATAFGSMFSRVMLGRAERLAADERAQARLGTELQALAKERARLAQSVIDAQAKLDEAASRLEQAQQAEAERARVEAERVRAEQIAAHGLFPVAGPTEYIDSWGFARAGGRRHKGTDIMAERGTPVVAVRDGSVAPGRNGLGGRIVWLTADDGTRYYYAHLDTIAVGVGRVVAGQVLGTVGDSGNARGGPTHLHFEIHRPQAVDPFPYLQRMVR